MVLFWLVLLLSSASSHAQPGFGLTTEKPKAAYDYIAVGVTLNEFRSVTLDLADADDGGTLVSLFPETAQPYSMSAVIGSYLNDFAKSEIRAGYGIADDTIDGALDVNIKYWFAWYMGLFYPITDYANVYAQYGISHFQADITRREVDREVELVEGLPQEVRLVPSRETMKDKLFGTSFSPTFLFGADFNLGQIFGLSSRHLRKTHIAFEYGRLLRDTESNIKVYQANVLFRYEY